MRFLEVGWCKVHLISVLRNFGPAERINLRLSSPGLHQIIPSDSGISTSSTSLCVLRLLAAEEISTLSTHCCNLLDVEAGVITANRKYTSFDMDQQFCYGINVTNR